MADLRDDLLVPLGSLVLPAGMRPGRSAGTMRVTGAGGATDMDLVPGGIELVDLAPGPANANYPARCLIQDNLMHHLGTVEKQIAGVFISKAEDITVSHNTIYAVPRAAIISPNSRTTCWACATAMP